MDLSSLYRIYLGKRIICTDTRKIEQDCIFFALRGSTFNGNDFAAEALSRGAS
ncbi:MAG: UDP-N-acetylmuramoyl-tripeptide--D-alanyl-D-alanine ligase, partial [Bacteroidales bacterium]|nr:UDP-N-acetylmuramoyl-tripeptide--D-alanyl-D-alanine ligase [Bacteroidales bacterium]